MNKVKILSIINIFLFLGVVAVNALANILPINNYNTGELSDMIPNLFVPAGMTFSIWGIIYLLLAVLVIVNLATSFKSATKNLYIINIFLMINFIFNMLWILAWHYRLIYLSLLVMSVIFLTLGVLDKTISKPSFENKKTIYYLTISVYFGWISVATIANITAVFVTMGWNGSPLTEEIWTVLVISIGAIIALLKVKVDKNVPFVLVFIWAYFGIIVKRLSEPTVYYSIIIISVISILFFVFSIFYALSRVKE